MTLERQDVNSAASSVGTYHTSKCRCIGRGKLKVNFLKIMEETERLVRENSVFFAITDKKGLVELNIAPIIRDGRNYLFAILEQYDQIPTAEEMPRMIPTVKQKPSLCERCGGEPTAFKTKTGAWLGPGCWKDAAQDERN